MRGAATMTSPAVMSAIRMTPSSIIRDSGSISSLLGVGERLHELVARVRAGHDEVQALEQGALFRRRGCRRLVARAAGVGHGGRTRPGRGRTAEPKLTRIGAPAVGVPLNGRFAHGTLASGPPSARREPSDEVSMGLIPPPS